MYITAKISWYTICTYMCVADYFEEMGWSKSCKCAQMYKYIDHIISNLGHQISESSYTVNDEGLANQHGSRSADKSLTNLPYS